MRLRTSIFVILAAAAIGVGGGMVYGERWNWGNAAHDLCYALSTGDIELHVIDRAKREILLDTMLAAPDLPADVKKIADFAKSGECT